jgi:uncharacterized protein YaiL (DUF2058 family)
MKKLSLQDQLLKAGLTSKAKANKVKSEKRKQIQQQQKNKISTVNEAKKQANAVIAQQVQKDKQLNDLRNQQAEQKQIANQIIQLINMNKIEQDEEGVAFNFTDDNKVKVLYISAGLKGDLVAGKAVITKLGNGYEIVSAKVADKIAQRDSAYIIELADTNLDIDDDYADYKIPDDLMW